MPKAGLEPACLAAPPPQDGVSANSTTSAVRKTFYLPDFSAGAGAGSFVSGAAGAGAAGAASLFSVPVAGGVVVGVVGAAGVVAFVGTTVRPPGLLDRIVSASDVTMKMIAAAVVAFERSVAAPR